MIINMSIVNIPEDLPKSLPTHKDLPESDGTFVKNFQEHPQSLLLTDSIRPILQQLHPDKQYCIGQDSGIYWRITDPPQKGAVSPDWFYVANVPPSLDGEMRRSYVLWQENIPPLIVIEFVSGDGSAERDQTPFEGKFWIYENVMRVPFYAIYEVRLSRVEVYGLVSSKYQLLPPNERGHFPIPIMGVELGIWQGLYINTELPWLRWWDNQGNLLLTGEERAQQTQTQLQQTQTQLQQTQTQLQEAENEKNQALQKAERLAQLLRERGIETDDLI